MKLTVSKYAGFCFGVRSAVDLIEKALEESRTKGKTICTLGMLIHNEDVVADLSRRGVRVIEDSDIDGLSPKENIIFLRSHGVAKDIVEKIERMGFEYIDATCPYVKKNHGIISDSLKKGAELVMIVGDRDHPEVRGMLSYCIGADAAVYASAEEIERDFSPEKAEKRAVILAQTTESVENYKKCLKIARKLYTNLTIFDTICRVTEKRQSDCESLAKESDFMVVIGGAGSSNTKKLFDIAVRYCPACRINNAEEIPYKSIMPLMKVGITAGASTPDRIIKEVANHMSDIRTDDKLSFEEMLDQSFKTLRTGEEVEGVVTSILPNEIHLDLGVKHTGILAMDEITDESSVNLHDMFKIGDKITVLLQKFSESDGIVRVSKRKIDERASRQRLMDGAESGETFSGKVSKAVNGGLIVMCEGQQVFIPAGKSGVPMGEDLAQLEGTTVKFKMISSDKDRRKLVGSIRAVMREERQALIEKFWETAAVGDIVEGVVRTVVTYGAFVDIGGIDGLIHVDEMTWSRTRRPSDIFKEGDKVRAYIKALNPETKKISLSCKFPEDDPWKLFTEKYSVGDIAEVKVMTIESYGAFCEIMPLVDGLVHVSKVCDRRIKTPAEVLNIGDVVRAEITDINEETKKVSLSIRAVAEREAAEAEEAEAAEAEAAEAEAAEDADTAEE